MLVEPCMHNLLHVVRRMRPLDRREVFALQWSDNEEVLAQKLIERQPNWVYCADDGEPVYAFGTSMVRPGVQSLWGFATDRWPEIAVRMTRVLRRNIRPWMKADGIHRIDCLSIVDKIDGHHWLKYLGAVEEATLHAYGRNGEDFKLFAWR